MATQVRVPRPADKIDRRIVTYAGDNWAAAPSGLLDVASGVVFHGSRGAQEARRVKRGGFAGIVAWDPDLYAPGSNAVEQGMFGFQEESVQNQLAMGVDLLLSPSTMPAQDDRDGIKKLLFDASAFISEAATAAPHRPAYAVLPLAPDWMRKHSDQLITDVQEASLPVAVVLAARGDPLDHPDAIDTAIALVEAVDAISLRCDLSALGLVAHGAAMGAIGQSSTYRHIYLPTRRAVESVRDGHVFVPELGNWLKRAVLGRIDSASPVLLCSCRICEGRPVSRLLPTTTKDESDLHATASINDLTRHVLEPTNAAERVSRWVSYCRGALKTWEEGPGLPDTTKPPGFLIGWGAWAT